jgi:hypothetical protein
MIKLMLNRKKANNYAFFCPVSRLHLTVSNPVGTADRVTSYILRGIRTKSIIDIDDVIDLSTGQLKQQNEIPAATNLATDLTGSNQITTDQNPKDENPPVNTDENDGNQQPNEPQQNEDGEEEAGIPSKNEENKDPENLNTDITTEEGTASTPEDETPVNTEELVTTPENTEDQILVGTEDQTQVPEDTEAQVLTPVVNTEDPAATAEDTKDETPKRRGRRAANAVDEAK